MSCTSFLRLCPIADYSVFSVSYCIFVPYLYRNKMVDNVQQNIVK